MSTCKNWWSRYCETGEVNTLPRSGRPKSLTPLQEAEIVAIFENQPFRSVVSIAEEYNVGVKPIHSLLTKNALRCRVAAKQTQLTEEHKLNRLAFCEAMLADWDENRLKTIVFSDEKVFSTDVRWRRKVYRPRGTRYEQKFTQKEKRSGRITSAFWGAISSDGPGGLMAIETRLNAQQYRQIIVNTVEPLMNSFDVPHVFMQDNSSVHTSRIVMDCLSTRNFRVLNWPPLSPDLNPIENVWSYITRDWPVFDHRNQDALNELVVHRWNSLNDQPGK